VIGTLADAREMHPELGPVKLIRLRAFRPFPAEALLRACAGVTDLVVLERALSPGGGGIVGVEVKAALFDMPNPPRVHNFAVGLGGRDIPLDIYPRLLQTVRSQLPGPFAVFDVELDKLPAEDR